MTSTSYQTCVNKNFNLRVRRIDFTDRRVSTHRPGAVHFLLWICWWLQLKLVTEILVLTFYNALDTNFVWYGLFHLQYSSSNRWQVENGTIRFSLFFYGINLSLFYRIIFWCFFCSFQNKLKRGCLCWMNQLWQQLELWTYYVHCVDVLWTITK